MFEVKIETENAAFQGNNGESRIEIARILRVIADKLEFQGRDGGTCTDMNGNTVGTFELTA